jgi:hypothetical protein
MTNSLSRRASEHAREKKMEIRAIMTGLTKDEARGVEQVLIETRGLEKNGGDLKNQINSIAKSSAKYDPLTRKGRELLKQIGHDTFKKPDPNPPRNPD